MVPYADLVMQLPPVSEGTAVDTPSLAARVSSLVRKVIGNRAVDAVGARLRVIRRGTGADQFPNRHLLELYSTTGGIDVSKAKSDLDFEPDKDVSERVREMADRLRDYR